MAHWTSRPFALLLIIGFSAMVAMQGARAQGPDPAWQIHDLGDVRLAAPSDWTRASFGEGETLTLASPDGERTLQVSWWQPDEPLLGYDDIVSHAPTEIDGHPALRIHSRYPSHDAISITLDAARADGRRLQFLFERQADLGCGDPVLDALLSRVIMRPEPVREGSGVSTDVTGADEIDWRRYVNARF